MVIGEIIDVSTWWSGEGACLATNYLGTVYKVYQQGVIHISLGYIVSTQISSQLSGSV